MLFKLRRPSSQLVLASIKLQKLQTEQTKISVALPSRSLHYLSLITLPSNRLACLYSKNTQLIDLLTDCQIADFPTTDNDVSCDSFETGNENLIASNVRDAIISLNTFTVPISNISIANTTIINQKTPTPTFHRPNLSP